MRHARILAVLTVLALTASDGAADTIALIPSIRYVAVDGNDAWSGVSEKPNAFGTGPKATVAAACKVVYNDTWGGSKIVRILPGEYFLDETIVIDTPDVSIVGQGADKPILYGGRKVTGWEKDGDKFYTAELEGVKDRSWDFRSLIVNGRYCPRARYPEEGTLTHESKFDVPWMTTTGGGWKRKPTEAELTTLKYKQGDLGPWLNTKNAEITVYHMWDESMVGIKTIDIDSQTLTFAGKTSHPPGGFGVHKYVIWNIRRGMTKPGQWYLDRAAGKLVYWPLPGEDMTTAHVVAPTLETIIRIEANDVSLWSLRIAATTTPLKAGGFGAGAFEGAVSIESKNDCSLTYLEIFNVAGQGINARGDFLAIRNSHIHHTGACGIKFSGMKVIVADNHVHHVGLTYPSAIAIRGGGKYSSIEYNEIHDTTYTAINCGGHKNKIQYNHIYRAMLELHDGGGIYCFAGDQLILQGNFIHDIPDTGGYGSSAYYLDERSENCFVEYNVSLRVARPSHNHMAKNNSIIGNVFITDSDMRLTFPRSENFTFERNVLLSGGKITFDNADAVTSWRRNVLFSRTGQIIDNRLNRYTRADSGELKLDPAYKNVIADPKMTIDEGGRITYAPDSPVDFGTGHAYKAGPRP